MVSTLFSTKGWDCDTLNSSEILNGIVFRRRTAYPNVWFHGGNSAQMGSDGKRLAFLPHLSPLGLNGNNGVYRVYYRVVIE